jgi:UDP-N-acetylglucosamine--N-acetylmuramyl-(pentapeptide) pyrophosphoryl-undecaprenol N-acetylglucosamine transferase
VVTGIPVRPALLQGNAFRGKQFLGWTEDDTKPVIAVMGGSLGSHALNRKIREALPTLLPSYRIVHLCGRGGLDSTLEGTAGYRQFEFLGSELPDVLTAVDAAISRAGATALFEYLALRLPHVLIPLPLSASRGDQIENAHSFSAKGWSLVLEQEAATPDALERSLKSILDPVNGFKAALEKSESGADGRRLLALIATVLGETSQG